MDQGKELPIGIESFDRIRRDGFYYIGAFENTKDEVTKIKWKYQKATGSVIEKKSPIGRKAIWIA